MPETIDGGTPSGAPAGSGGAPDGGDREVWGTQLGFILAAVGSAVGLGNMWRFPYVTSESGGAAFVLLYILMTLCVGIPIMLSEFAVGRRGRLSPVGALRKTGGAAWVPLGFLFVATGFLILAYYSVIAGWTIRYALEAILAGFPAAPQEHFEAISSGGPAIAYHLLFMAVTIAIVIGGIRKGIERAALALMPVLFLILVGLAVWAGALPGSGEGYAFYLAPSLEELTDPEVIANAAGQAFFSLSLGMGAMLTFASYLSKHENLNREAVIISASDFMVAFIAGLVVFPVIFALGLSDGVGESTLGALFISLPGAFTEMGGIGRVVGAFFFVALTVGALTSAVSLLEVVVSSVIDEWSVTRRQATLVGGALIALVGLWPAVSLDVLGKIDALAGNFFLVLGALFIALFVGWRMDDPKAELYDGASGLFRKVIPLWYVVVRFVVPLIILWVLYNTAKTTWAAFFPA